MLQRDRDRGARRSVDFDTNPHEGIHQELMSKEAFSPLRSSLRIAGIYFIVSCLWILLTDRLLSALTPNVELLTMINIFKGWFFVFITALLTFSLILRTLRRIKKTEASLGLAYADMTRAHEELEAAYEELTATEDELRQQYDQLIENERRLTESEDRMHHLAYHDVLTGLPNKRALYENGDELLTATSGNVALMFVDIDNFKYINDTMGHGFGDRLIIQASERLISLVGLDEGSIYRFGGDEFIILLHQLGGTADISHIADRIVDGFKEAFDMDNRLLHVSVSVGISVFPEQGADMMELVKRADIAMYKAKEAGKDNFVVFDDHLNDAFTERMAIEKHLYTAMEHGEFELFYQPQVDLALNQITGLEALLRWRSPELGNVSPTKFIKVAEDTHLIIPLGAWVINEACAFLQRLHRQGFDHLTMSVNISVLQLLQADFNDFVFQQLRHFGLEPEYLELELTESVLIESYEYVSSKLKDLRDSNIKIALDDFGTGYSSLSYLTHLPISTLKIDKSFIHSITGTKQAALVKQVISIGKQMDMCVIAEGVERMEQLEYLQKQGCDKIQGYLFSKPLAAKEMEQLLANWNRTEASRPMRGTWSLE